MRNYRQWSQIDGKYTLHLSMNLERWDYKSAEERDGEIPKIRQPGEYGILTEDNGHLPTGREGADDDDLIMSGRSDGMASKSSAMMVKALIR